MEQGLQLSEQLIADLGSVLQKHDTRAEDAGVAVQYYAAVLGFVIGQQNFAYADKKEFLNQLLGFAVHVFEDVARPEGETAAPAGGNEAFGIWRPE